MRSFDVDCVIELAIPRLWIF